MLIKEIFRTDYLIFQKIAIDSINESASIIQPIEGVLVPDVEGDFIVKAIQVCSDREIDCFVTLCLPERLRGTVYKFEDGRITLEDPFDSNSVVVPQVGFEMYGDYTLFLAEQNPHVGVRILKKLIEGQPSIGAIAEDLGYLLRDLNDIEGALEAFHHAERIGPSSGYIYLELSRLYKRLDMHSQERHYKALFESVT